MLNIKKITELLKKKKLESYSEEIIDQLMLSIEKTLEGKIKEIKNKKRIIANDNSKDFIAATDELSLKEISSLPNWVKKEIKEARIIGKSKKVLQIKNGKKFHLNNKLNDLSGGEWTFFLNSIVNTRYPTVGNESFAYHIRKEHPSPKPPQLMQEIIEFFSKEDELIFDFFMGVGGTLLGASMSGRRAIGIDLSKNYINVYKKANKYLGLKEQKTIKANSIEFLKNDSLVKKYIKKEEVSLILIDPPYGDMLSRPRTGETLKKQGISKSTPFTKSCEDLGNMSWENFLKQFIASIKNSLSLLKVKGHIVVFIKDLQPKNGELNLLHCDIIRGLDKIDNLNYLGTKIWADQGVNLYPYGYPYSYVSNQIHQYIMIFRKG
jgi:16S rRNA G966 N2-methylase RsmD